MKPQNSPGGTPEKLGDFTDQATAYHTARPGYPSDLLEHLSNHISLPPRAAVTDLGAGTGIFTAELAERGLSVSAVEPNAQMREMAKPHTCVTWIDGTFDQTHLPEGSQQWVVAAQAFHWADPTTALPEAHRILKPAGYFTVLWNNRLNHDAPALAQAWAVIKHFVPDFDDNYRENDWPEVLTSTGHFADVHPFQVRHEIKMPRERFLNLWRSHNRLNTLAGPQRFAKIIKAIEDDLDRAEMQSVTVPYLCKSWTARRND